MEVDFVKLHMTGNNGDGEDIRSICKLDGDNMVLAVRNDGGPRPRQFSHLLTAGSERATHVFYFTPRLRKKLPKKRRPSPWKANARTWKKRPSRNCTGLWILDKAKENNGEGRFRQFDGGIYIEKRKVIWVQKNGLIGSPHWEAIVEVDPTKIPLEMDFVKVENKGAGTDNDIKMIYKIEDNKLTIAIRVENETRPRQFTTDLTAGSETRHPRLLLPEENQELAISN